MRPQFSLLALLLLVPYAAIVAAAATDVFSFWARVAIWAVPGFFLIACVVAIFARDKRRVFACGMIVGLLFVACYSLVPLPPQTWIMRSLPDPLESLEFHEDFDAYDFGVFLAKSIFVASQLTLAGGVTSGFIAVAFWGRMAKVVHLFPVFIPGSAVRENRQAPQDYRPRSRGGEPNARSIRDG